MASDSSITQVINQPSSKGFDVIQKVFHGSPIYVNTEKICSGEKQETLYFLTAFFGVMIGVAWIDEDIKHQEVEYLKGYLDTWLNLGPDKINSLIDLNISIIREYEMYDNDIPFFVEYLSGLFDDKQKTKFLESLLVITRIDKKTNIFEQLYIADISDKFGLSRDKLSRLVSDATRVIGNEFDEKTNSIHILRGNEAFDWEESWRSKLKKEKK